ESLKRQVVEAMLAAMHAQVEPHFLFNTLASIDHLIEVDPPRASRMQKNLIALLRASMPAMRESAATLGRELQVVRPYLEILKVRMEDRLRAEISVAEGLYSADFPPMVLQSLVENAIKHGLEPKPEGGALRRGQLRARLAEVWPELEIAAEARNGAEAVELVAAERPDVVFLDIRMPAKSGIEAAREIAALPRESRVPEIVFVTAYD